MDIVLPVSHVLGLLAFVLQIALAGGFIYALFFRQRYPGRFAGKSIDDGMLWAFLISLVATLGSLFYSQIAGFAPCELCWYQRIFMYPVAVLLGIALFKEDHAIIDYILALAGIGAVISLYHNYIFYGGAPVTSCGIGAETAVSCTQRYVVEMGYITIPLMALTAFVSIIFLLIAKKYFSEK